MNKEIINKLKSISEEISKINNLNEERYNELQKAREKYTAVIKSNNTKVLFPYFVTSLYEDNELDTYYDSPYFINLERGTKKESFLKEFDLFNKRNIDEDTLKSEKDNFINSFIEFEKVFKESEKELESLRENNSKEIEKINQEFDNKIKELEDKLNGEDIINKKYYYLLPQIIEILEDGRAANHIDALNLAIKEEKDEKHKQELLEIEKEKLREMQRNNYVLEEEERKKNQMLEDDLAKQRRIQEEHNSDMKKLLEKQADLEKERAEKERRKETVLEWEEKKRQRNLNEAVRKYEIAASKYRTQNSETARRDMDYWFAEMQKYK